MYERKNDDLNDLNENASTFRIGDITNKTS